MVCMSSYAYHFQSGGIYYNIIGDSAYVTYGDDKYNGDIIIPNKITFNDKSYIVTSIGYNAFSGCSSLTSISIPNTVTSIGQRAFYGCSSLSSISIPNTVMSIGQYAFYNCYGLTSIKVENGNVNYNSPNGCNALIETATNTLIVGCKNTIIPNTVTSINHYAFLNCTGLTSIIIPNSVSDIGNSAFEGCNNVTSITLPNSVISIGSSAFKGCSNLTSINIPNSLNSISGYVFSGCTSLTSIIIPSSVTNIEYDAFEGCSSLISITIPNSVTSIGSSAFKGCSNLKSISILGNITRIQYETFSGCNSLTSIILPKTVERIEKRAFIGCSSLISINIPEAVTRIEDETFSGCSSLISITLPNAITHIGKSSFRECSSLVSFTIPNLVTNIESNTFYNCKKLTSIEIPNNVISIGDYAFAGCDDLASVTISNSVKYIRDYSFSGCINLTSIISKITNPAGMVMIDPFSYYTYNKATLFVPVGTKAKYQSTENWSKFKSIIEVEGSETSTKRTIHVATAGTLPDLISESEKYTIEELTLTGELNGTDFRLLRDMAGCDYNGEETVGKLTILDFSGAKVVAGGDNYVDPSKFENISGTPFKSRNDILPQHVFHGCKYLSVKLSTSVTSIEADAFNNCRGLTSITIPSSVTSIGSYAFWDCSGLTSITIPSSVTSIRNGVFSGCSGLASIKVESGNTIYDSRNDCNAIIRKSDNELIAGCKNTVILNSVTSIGDEAFRACSSLTSIMIPSSVMSIGSYAFGDCSGLTSITIPNSVTSIGDWAFYKCSSLTSIISEIVRPFDIGWFVFSNYTTATLTVPRGTKSAYQSTNYWNKFTNIVETSGIDDLWLKEIQEMKSNCENLLSGVPQKFDSEVARFNLRIEEQNIYLEENNKILHGSLLQLSYDLDDAEQRIEEGTMTEEYMQNLREEYERVSKAFDEMRQFYDEVSHNIVEAVFQCNEGGVIKLGANKKIENQQETIRWTTVEKLKFSIDVIPNDGYSIKSIQVNGTPVSGTTFSSTDINGDFIAQFEKGGSNEKLLELQRMIKGCSDILSEIDKTYTDLTEGREFLPMHKEYLQRTFETMEYDVNQLKEKLEQYETNMEDLTTETLNSLVKEYEELMQKMTLDSDYSPLGSFPSCLQSGTFSCGNGGCMKINNGYEIRNETKILYSFYPKAYNNYFDSYRNPTFTISLIPDDGYRIASLKVGGNETTKTTFDSFEATNSFVATFERVNNSTKRAIHVATAGSLPDSIAESEKYIIEELTLTGELNGTDFRLLRDMAGCDYLGKDTDGKLKVLDISGAKIVAGGEKYLDTDQVSEWSGSFHFSLDSDNRLPNHIFHGCKFTTVIVSSNATSIGDFSFADCGVLTSITIPNSVTNIGFSAFINCSNLTSIMIPNSVTTIGKDAFNNCSGLASITISSAITKIENSTFFGCKSLSSITIPNAVTSIGSEAFYGCIGLTSITIPNSVISIGSFAFYNCHNLPTITIPNSVTSIGGYAFHYCSSLTSIISGIVNPFEINENVFSNYSKPTLTVPSGTKPAYQSTAAWNKFTNIIESASSDVRFTQQGITYRGATSTLKAEVRSVNDDKVVIPATVSYGGSTYDVTSVADGVLSNRTFDYVSLPSTITSLESSTFSNSTLGALIWNANTSLPSNVISNMAMSTTSNFLLYVNKKEFAPSNVSNVVVGNTATSITLADGMNTRFYCPRSFTAQTISYTHHYGMMTGGNGKGWETIALPFDVQRIEHKTKGVLTPFALYSDMMTQRPFWLYELGSNGFRKTDAIKANKPYIIAMPNDTKYDEEYILAGDVTFSATNATVIETGSLTMSISNGKTYIPAFAVEQKASTIYALNVSNELTVNTTSYDPGSRFVPNLRQVYPFEAYMTSSSSARSLVIEFEDELTGFDEVPLKEQRSGIVKVYTLTGLLMFSVPQSEFADKWQSLPSGVYIVNGQKMIKLDAQYNIVQ